VHVSENAVEELGNGDDLPLKADHKEFEHIID